MEAEVKRAKSGAPRLPGRYCVFDSAIVIDIPGFETGDARARVSGKDPGAGGVRDRAQGGGPLPEPGHAGTSLEAAWGENRDDYGLVMGFGAGEGRFSGYRVSRAMVTANDGGAPVRIADASRGGRLEQIAIWAYPVDVLSTTRTGKGMP